MIERTANGITRGFKFGTYTLKIIKDLTGLSDVREVFKRLEGGDISFLSSFYYACAMHHNMSLKLPVDFNEMDISDWVDDLGLEGAGEIFQELVKTYNVKNFRAPSPGPIQSQP